MTLTAEEAAVVAAELEPLSAGERLRLLQEQFAGRIVASTSFGVQSAVMLHLIAENAPGMKPASNSLPTSCSTIIA